MYTIFVSVCKHCECVLFIARALVFGDSAGREYCSVGVYDFRFASVVRVRAKNIVYLMYTLYIFFLWFRRFGTCIFLRFYYIFFFYAKRLPRVDGFRGVTDDIVRCWSDGGWRKHETRGRSQFVFPYHFAGSPFREHSPSRPFHSRVRALENRCLPPPVDLPPPPSSLINILLLFPRACVPLFIAYWTLLCHHRWTLPEFLLAHNTAR